MAGEFHKLKTKTFEKHAGAEEKAEDYDYWTGFKLSKIVKEYSAITTIDVSPVAPHDIAVTCSAKAQVFSGRDESVVKTYSRNKDNVFGCRFRSDGKLLIAGGESGTVQVLSSISRSILRIFKGHTQCCRVCCFASEFRTVYTASDDMTLRIWDVPTSQATSVLKEHKDFIRCGCTVPTRPNLFVTGSYDHSVKVWDSRLEKSVFTLQHAQPVEHVLCYKTGGVLYTAGGDYVRTWDLLSGGKLLTEIHGHTKAVTALCFDQNHTRLLTGSLDRRVKVYNTADNTLVANLDYPSPILSLGLDGLGKRLIVGMSDGAISIKSQPSTKQAPTAGKLRAARPGTVRYNIRGGDAKPKPDDVVVHTEEQRQKIHQVDRALKNFNYQKALSSAFTCRDPAYVVSVLIELSRHNRLKSCLENNNVTGIVKIMKFVVKFIIDARYTSTLSDISHVIIDTHKHWVGKHAAYDTMLKKLNQRLKVEKRNQVEMMRCLGVLDAMLALASVGQVGKFASLQSATNACDDIADEEGISPEEVARQEGEALRGRTATSDEGESEEEIEDESMNNGVPDDAQPGASDQETGSESANDSDEGDVDMEDNTEDVAASEGAVMTNGHSSDSEPPASGLLHSDKDDDSVDFDLTPSQ